MPSQNKAIVDKLLTNVSSMYVPEGLIADKILPFIGVTQSTGKLGKYGTSHLRIENSIKVGRGKYRQVEPIVRASDTYSIEGHGLEGMVTADDYRNVEKPFDAEKDETLGVTTLIALEKEKLLADTLGNASILTQGITLTNEWDDYTNSTPLQDLVLAQTTVLDGCGFQPNVAILDRKVAIAIRFNPAFLDKLGYKDNRPGGLTDAEIAQVLGVERCFIADAAYESAKEGQASSMQRVWGENLILAYIPKSAAPYQTSLGYRLGYSNQEQRQVYKWDVKNPPNSTAVLVEDNYQFLITNAKAGYLMKNLLS